MTDLIRKLVVPRGTRLTEGKLYMRLYHGRNDPNENLDAWGFHGPVFGPLSDVVLTYLNTIRIYGLDSYDELWIQTHDDMVVWEGKYFGDFEIFVARPNDTAWNPQTEEGTPDIP